MARCAVPARVQRAELLIDDERIAVLLALLNAARTAQRAIPTQALLAACRSRGPCA
jgi:hypothetical protein